MNLVTAAQMKMAEEACNAAGHTFEMMMECAGRAVAQAIDMQFSASGRQITVLIGPGNNGGDGLVAARYLAELGAFVTLYFWKRPNLETDSNWQKLQSYDLPVALWNDDPGGQVLVEILGRSAIVVDALLGTGISRPIEGDLADLLRTAGGVIRRRRGPEAQTIVDPLAPAQIEEIGPAVVAVDLPSGLNTDTGAVDPLTLPADMTITFAAPKWGHVTMPGPIYTGRLLVADIGVCAGHFPAGLPQLAGPALAAELLPERPTYGHKGTFGKAMIVAGSVNYTGAPYLAAVAAYRVGAGLVTLALPASIQMMVAARLTEATFVPLPEGGGAISAPATSVLLKVVDGYSALLIGPGLGTESCTARFLADLLPLLPPLPLVLDADALNLLARMPEWWTFLPPRCVLTPHPGEMSRLSGQTRAEIEADRPAFALAMAKKWGQVVALKGAFTVVARPDGRVVVLPFANPALATAGSGDVLAGAISGLLAQGLPPFEAAVAGAYLHGLAGETARAEIGEAGVLAGELADYLPGAIREIKQD